MQRSCHAGHVTGQCTALCMSSTLFLAIILAAVVRVKMRSKTSKPCCIKVERQSKVALFTEQRLHLCQRPSKAPKEEVQRSTKVRRRKQRRDRGEQAKAAQKWQYAEALAPETLDLATIPPSKCLYLSATRRSKETDQRSHCGLILKYGQDVILQQLRPRSPRCLAHARAAESKGRLLLDASLRECLKRQEKKAQKSAQPSRGKRARQGIEDVDPAQNFGVWVTQSQLSICVTQQTRDADPDTIAQLCVWLQHLTDKQLYKRGTLRSDIHPDFRQIMQKRAAMLQEVIKRVPDAALLCHPLWTTFTPFRGLTGNFHIDSKDECPNLLFNFGEKAALEIREKGATGMLCSVVMQPYDIVLLHTSKYEHRTTIVPDTLALLPTASLEERMLETKRRWGVSAYFRNDVTTISRAEKRQKVLREALKKHGAGNYSMQDKSARLGSVEIKTEQT